MTRIEAKNNLCNYLKRNQIPFEENIDNRAIQLTMVYKAYYNCPNKVIESCIWMYKDSMEVRVYYSEMASEIFEKSKYKMELYRLINFINACVWPSVCDGANNTLYQPECLHKPVLYVTEDGYNDITLTSFIKYDFYEQAPLETEDYITVCCPEFLNTLSIFIFKVLLGNITSEEAIEHIKKDVLEDRKDIL